MAIVSFSTGCLAQGNEPPPGFISGACDYCDVELMKDGDIAGWNINLHRLGGMYRRLATITGADHASVVDANARAIQSANENHSALVEEISSICDTRGLFVGHSQPEKEAVITETRQAGTIFVFRENNRTKLISRPRIQFTNS